MTPFLFSKYFVSAYFLSSVLCLLNDFNFVNWRGNRIFPVSKKEYRKIIKNTSINLFICIPILTDLLCPYITEDGPLESPGILIAKICTIMVILDIMFYITHRLFHIPFFYRHFHSLHHKLRNPIGYGAIYTTIPDLLFTSILPVYVAFAISRPSAALTKMILFFIGFSTVYISHSGYNTDQHHLLHHIYTNVNYGLYFTDKLFGTLRIKPVEWV